MKLSPQEFIWDSTPSLDGNVPKKDKDFTSGLILSFTPSSFPSQLKIHKDTPKSLSLFYKDFLRSFKFVKRQGVDITWEAEETDSLGTFMANYTFIATATGFQIEKNKTEEYKPEKYTKELSQEAVENHIVKSHAVWTWEKGKLVSFKQDEVIDVHINYKKIGFHKRTLVMTLLGKNQVAQKQTKKVEKNPVNEYAEVTEKESDLDITIAKNTLKNKTLQDIVKLSEGSEPNITTLFTLLKSYFILNPDKLTLALDMILENEFNSPLYKAIIPALQIIGTHEAQEQFLAAIKQTDGEKKMDMIATLSFLKQPTQKTLDNLLDMTQSTDSDVRQLSQLALGGAVKEANSTKSADTTEYTKSIETSALQSQNKDETNFNLKVIGNAGMNTPADWVESQLTSTDEDIRIQASQALRFVETREATTRLYRVLQEDSSVSVRRSAAVALQYRIIPAKDVTLLKNMLDKEGSETVRKGLYTLIVENHLKKERDYIIQKSNEEPDKDLRNYLKSQVHNL